MESRGTTLNRSNWPIAAAMIPFPGVLPDGTSVQDQSVEGWATTLQEVVDAGFTELDPTDSWLRVADLAPARQDEFFALAKAMKLTIPAISTSRRSVIDPVHGDEYLSYSHRVIDAAARCGAKAVSFGLFGPFTPAQKAVLWFWTAEGCAIPTIPPSAPRRWRGFANWVGTRRSRASTSCSRCTRTPTLALPTMRYALSPTSTCPMWGSIRTSAT